MRICCLSTQTPAHVAVGGMALQTRLLSEGIAARGHEVTVITTRHPDGCTTEERNGVHTHYLAGTRPGITEGGWWGASVAALARLQAEQPFDVVWSQSIAAARVARSARCAGAPPLVSFIHGTGPAMARSLINGIVLTPGGWTTTLAASRRLARCVSNFVLVDRPIYRRAGAVIAVSEAVRASIATWYRVPAERLFVVPNGVDTTRFGPDVATRVRERRRLGYDDATRVLLVCGALTPQKGVDVAIEALARLARRDPRVQLVVAGEGPHRAALQRRARTKGVEQLVRFVGAVPADLMPGLYNAADVFLFPTVRVEAFGMVTAEAMATGLPVVVSRVGAIPEVVRDGESGVLVPPGDVDALTAAIEGVLADPERAAALGRRGRERALSTFTLHSRIDRVLAIFEAVAARR